MISYIKNLFLTIIAGIYLLHSSFALGLSFFGHHQTNTNNTSAELTCWPESENCCSSTNSCVQLCVSEEYQTYSKDNLEFHDHNESCDKNFFHTALLSFNIEDLYTIPHIAQHFSERNIFTFNETDLVWIIKLTI